MNRIAKIKEAIKHDAYVQREKRKVWEEAARVIALEEDVVRILAITNFLRTDPHADYMWLEVYTAIKSSMANVFDRELYNSANWRTRLFGNKKQFLPNDVCHCYRFSSNIDYLLEDIKFPSFGRRFQRKVLVQETNKGAKDSAER